MAFSEFQLPPDAQRYLVCGTEDCEKNCQFYCNDCHQPMCEQCRDGHQKNKKIKNHEVVPYKQRKRRLPVEKCKIHPKKEMVFLCDDCQISLCYKCADTKEHSGHAIIDLEMVFDEYFEPTSQGLKKEIAGDKSDEKQTLSLSSSVTKVDEYTIPGVDVVYHISLGKSGRLWVSDRDGYIVPTDLQGNQLPKIRTSGRDEGYHTVTQDGDLIYTDKDNKVINTDTIPNFIKTDWRPLSIHSSHINGDILVGMRKDGEHSKIARYNKMMKDREAKVTRYNKTGTEIQNIQRDNKGQELYGDPLYITENINGDICVSDFDKDTVVVVDKSGQHRFSYTGQRSGFNPFGICTDVLGHILVCDYFNEIHLLDQDGQFLSLLLTKQQGVKLPRSVCVDDKNNFWVGQRDTNTVTVYKYLH